MGKILMTAFMAISVALNAQEQTASLSFALGSGYTIGPINGQNGWQAITTEGSDITGCNVVSSAPGTTSPNSCLSVGPDTALGSSENENNFMCISPSLIPFPYITALANTSISFQIHQDDNILTPGSDYAVEFRDDQGITVSIGLFADHSIKILDDVNGIIGYVDTGFEWEMPESGAEGSGQWTQIFIEYNVTSGIITYKINGEIIYLGNLLAGRSMERLVITHNNKTGSTAYFDGLFVFGFSQELLDWMEALDVANQSPPLEVSIYPNPANDTVAILNTENIFSGTATIMDTNGRVIQSLAISGNASESNIDVSGLSAGVYVINISTEQGSLSKKIIKQ